MNNKKARVIAMYLPQYHSIPENDKYWGKGFTEWTNVAKSRPLFRGHYQPQLPADLGFYDLLNPIVREVQAGMAREAGIEGFMYWHYWLGGGKLLLEKPFQEVLKSGKPDFPFCLGWANHSWNTKTWTKMATFQKNTMIAEQLYPGKEDYINHFNYVLPAFNDKRYITVDGKPLFVVFDPLSVPDMKEFITLWGKLAKKNGLEGIHFVGIRYGRKSSIQQLLDMDFDAVNERNQAEAESKLMRSKYIRIIRNQLSLKLHGLLLQRYNYKDIIKHLFTDNDKLEYVYPTIISNYDRTPRAGRQAIIYHKSTPDLFAQHIDDALKLIENKSPEHKIIFLKSWNEWGEGNYVEPDIRYGNGYLQVLHDKLTS